MASEYSIRTSAVHIPGVPPAASPGSVPISSKGERIELLQRRLGVPVRGTVFYSDQLQILVKWDDGRTGSLRLGRETDAFRIVEGGGV